MVVQCGSAWGESRTVLTKRLHLAHVPAVATPCPTSLDLALQFTLPCNISPFQNLRVKGLHPLVAVCSPFGLEHQIRGGKVNVVIQS